MLVYQRVWDYMGLWRFFFEFIGVARTIIRELGDPAPMEILSTN